MFEKGDVTVSRTDSKWLCRLLLSLDFLFSLINLAAVAFLTNLVDPTSYKERHHNNLVGVQDLFLGLLVAWPRSLLMVEVKTARRCTQSWASPGRYSCCSLACRRQFLVSYGQKWWTASFSQHLLLSLLQNKAYVKTTQSKEPTQHKCFPFQQRLFGRATQCRVCSSHCHKWTFSQCRSPKAILGGVEAPWLLDSGLFLQEFYGLSSVIPWISNGIKPTPFPIGMKGSCRSTSSPLSVWSPAKMPCL